jgi:type IV pilus assembly protein PilM
MFKRTKETERINLLDTDFSTVVKNKVRDDSAGNVFLIAAVAGALVIGGGAWIIQSARNKSVENDIVKTENYINSEDTQRQLRQHEHLLLLRDQVTENRDKMNNLKEAYLSQPAIDGDKYLVLEDTLKESYADALKNLVGEDAEEAGETDGQLAEAIVELFGDSLFKVVNPQYTDGMLTFTANAIALEEKSQKLPAAYTEELLKKPEFMAVGYSGYKVNEESVKVGDTEVKVYVLSFNVAAQLDAEESAYHPEAEDSSADESTEEEAE